MSCPVTFVCLFVCKGEEDTLNGTNTAIRNVGWGRSFKCNRNIRYDLTSKEDNSTGTASIMFNSIQVQVFNFTAPPGEFNAGIYLHSL